MIFFNAATVTCSTGKLLSTHQHPQFQLLKKKKVFLLLFDPFISFIKKKEKKRTPKREITK